MKTGHRQRKSSSFNFDLDNKRMVLFLGFILISLISYILYQVGGIFNFVKLFF